MAAISLNDTILIEHKDYHEVAEKFRQYLEALEAALTDGELTVPAVSDYITE